MHARMTWATAVLAAAIGWGPANATQNTPAQSAAEEALGGLDVVRLIQGQELDGKDELAVSYHGLVYYFSTPETKAAFEREPARYAVQLDGMCARMGPPILGEQSLHAVHDGRIYVFGSTACQERFVAEPGRFLDRAPSPLAGATPAMVERGRALLDRAVAAVGGAALADVRGFRERTSQVVTGPQGPVQLTADTAALLPDRWRRETSNQYGRFLVVLTPDAAFRASAGRSPRTMNDAQRAYYRGALAGHPLALLRAHRVHALRAAALDAIKEHGTSLDRVAGDHGGAIVVVTLDPSGLPRSLTTRGHSPEDGVITDIVQALDDYRPVGALRLPFRVETRIDGRAVPALSYAVETIELNPPVDAAWMAGPMETRP